MSIASRKLDIGAKVTTNFSGKITSHVITARLDGSHSSSDISFQVKPKIKGSVTHQGENPWIDADWFEVAE